MKIDYSPKSASDLILIFKRWACNRWAFPTKRGKGDGASSVQRKETPPEDSTYFLNEAKKYDWYPFFKSKIPSADEQIRSYYNAKQRGYDTANIYETGWVSDNSTGEGGGGGMGGADKRARPPSPRGEGGMGGADKRARPPSPRGEGGAGAAEVIDLTETEPDGTSGNPIPLDSLVTDCLQKLHIRLNRLETVWGEYV